MTNEQIEKTLEYASKYPSILLADFLTRKFNFDSNERYKAKDLLISKELFVQSGKSKHKLSDKSLDILSEYGSWIKYQEYISSEQAKNQKREMLKDENLEYDNKLKKFEAKWKIKIYIIITITTFVNVLISILIHVSSFDTYAEKKQKPLAKEKEQLPKQELDSMSYPSNQKNH
ncbi:hypothetical protein [Aquimarina algiphila]|nr:hypothetical protein [Aquimarina algiphila]